MKLATILIGTSVLSAAAAPDWEAEGRRWWSHVEYLASDRLEGRDTGSRGHRLAAEYVAQEFEKTGLRAAGTSGYFQPVRLNVRRIEEDRSRVDFVRDGRAEPVKLGEDAILSPRGEGGSVEAEAVFVGYGLVIPELNYDDLAGLDLRGKIAVYLSGGPKSAPGPLKAHYQSGAERWKALGTAGAVGTASIQNPKTAEVPWSRIALARLRPAMTLADGEEEPGAPRFSLTLNPERAERFFAGSGHTLAEVLAASDAGRPLPRFPLKAVFRARVAVKDSTAESDNVVAVLPGSERNEEHVVLSAHLDHLGKGDAGRGDRVYNGAMDDASGVASLVEIARLLKGRTPKRSIVFLAVTGEEKGLLGSRYFASKPTLAGEIVADINMDMYLPLTPLRSLEVQGLGESTLGDAIRAAGRDGGVEILADQEPDHNRFIRSDQYSFIRKGIPSLAFKFGYEKGSPEEQVYRAWYKERYHAAGDDLLQPVNLPAAAQFNHVVLALADRVANAGDRPRWAPASFFRRFAQAEGGGAQDWKPWAARPEIAPRTYIDGSALAISGNSNAAAYGGWERNLKVEPGRWYRFTARYRAEGLTYERMQVVSRLDWKAADGRRTGQPEYAWMMRRDGEWRNVTIEAQAPEKAASVTLQLYLANAPQATVWWKDASLDPIAAPPKRPVAVAALNFRPVKTTGSAAESVRQMIEAADRAIPKADVILLGEGITVVNTGLKYADVAETVPGPTTGRLGELARRKHAWVVAGVYEREGVAIYNTAVLIDRDGKYAGKYRKVYLPREEIEGGLTPGNDYPVFDTDFGKVGLMICWDLEYADPARALALRGAELILLPIWGGNTTLGKARAIENHVFLAAAGYDHPTYVLDPDGETIAAAPERGMAAVATIDLARRYPDPWLGDMRARFMKELRLDVPVVPQ